MVSSVEVQVGEEANLMPVLIIDGFSNHYWERTTECLKIILERDGRFVVEVSTCPDPLANESEWKEWSPRFENYSVVIQTCNDLGDTGKYWPDEVRRSFEDYVSGGGGVYMHHSANNAFENWEAYNLMLGLAWRHKDFGVSLVLDDDEHLVAIPTGEGEDTDHGERVDAFVTRVGEHPIHKGYPKSWLAADIEVYRYARGPAKNIEVISYAREDKTGLNTPIEWVVSYGEGRVYCSTYGHLWANDVWPEGIRCRAFQESLVRALQWLSGSEIDSELSESFPTTEKVSLSEVD